MYFFQNGMSKKRNDHRTANLLDVLFEYTTINNYRVDEDQNDTKKIEYREKRFENMHEKNVFNICV